MTGNQVVFVSDELRKHGYFNADGTVSKKGIEAIAYYHQAKHGRNPLNLSPMKTSITNTCTII